MSTKTIKEMAFQNLLDDRSYGKKGKPAYCKWYGKYLPFQKGKARNFFWRLYNLFL